MTQNITLELTHDVFQILRQFPRIKFKPTDGLTRSEQELLVMLVINLDEEKKAFTVTEISNLLQITPAGVTHLLNPLEAAGYIERLPAPNDRRVVRVGLTDKGTQEAESITSGVQEKIAEMVNFLGEEDSKTFMRLMVKVIAFFAA
ncbi:MAG: MarR family transcriptional regulator [Anaerolineales bacterium]